MDFRKDIAKAVGIPLEKMQGFCSDGFPWSLLKPDPIYTLLNHSDCEGTIEPADCKPLSCRLTGLIGAVPGWERELEAFAKGLMDAFEKGESVDFH